MKMFRLVKSPIEVEGRLYLHSMPGFMERYEDAKAEIEGSRIDHVICLNGMEEIKPRSPEYAMDILNKDTGWDQVMFPIRDFGVPYDWDLFLELALSVAERLRRRKNILVHCAMGIGRAGSLACATLIALGMDVKTAQGAVREAGSSAESISQRDLILWVYERVKDQSAR